MELQVKEVRFNGERIMAIREEGKIYVSIKSVCKNLGMNKSQADYQIQKVQNDELLDSACYFKHLEINGITQKGLMLELDYLPIWLAKINPSRFSEELKKQLIEYQLKAKDVLADEFLGKRTLPEVQTSIAMIPLNKAHYWAEIKSIADNASKVRKRTYKKLCKLTQDLAAITKEVDDLAGMTFDVEELLNKIEN